MIARLRSASRSSPSTQKYFGEGTALSQNAEAQQGIFGSTLDFLNVSEENLFTRNSIRRLNLRQRAALGVLSKKPLLRNCRASDLSYRFHQTSVKDPAVNRGRTASANFIPIIYSQPDILTSRLTPTTRLRLARITRRTRPIPSAARRFQLRWPSQDWSATSAHIRRRFPTRSFIPVRRKGARPEA